MCTGAVVSGLSACFLPASALPLFASGLFCRVCRGPVFVHRRGGLVTFRLLFAFAWPALGLLLFCYGLLAAGLFLCTGAAFYARPVCSRLASGLLLACFVCLASGLLLAVLLHRRGGFCTSGLLRLACCWPALSGLCCLGLACCARAVVRNRKLLIQPREECQLSLTKVQLPSLRLDHDPCNLQRIWNATPVI